MKLYHPKTNRLERKFRKWLEGCITYAQVTGQPISADREIEFIKDEVEGIIKEVYTEGDEKLLNLFNTMLIYVRQANEPKSTELLEKLVAETELFFKLKNHENQRTN